MLLFKGSDEPGVIGHVGSILSRHSINIAGMYNSRETIGGQAIMVIVIDTEPTPETYEDLQISTRFTPSTKYSCSRSDRTIEVLTRGGLPSYGFLPVSADTTTSRRAGVPEDRDSNPSQPSARPTSATAASCARSSTADSSSVRTSRSRMSTCPSQTVCLTSDAAAA
ncbi:ACT domain-containing protein [Natrialba swarupiae]|nr:ACT domain-containing protein [Natrialba swarupiae]